MQYYGLLHRANKNYVFRDETEFNTHLMNVVVCCFLGVTTHCGCIFTAR